MVQTIFVALELFARAGGGGSGGGDGAGSSAGNAIVKAGGRLATPEYPSMSLENDEEGTPS